jgi:hypothetical protein
MTRLCLALIATGLLFAACGGSGAAATPEAAFKAVQSAVKARDWGQFHDLLAEEGRNQFRDDYEGLKEDPSEAEEIGLKPEDVADLEFRAFFILMMEKEAEGMDEMFDKFAEAEILDVKVEGDEAEVKFKIEDDEETMEFRKVDGAWLVADL